MADVHKTDLAARVAAKLGGSKTQGVAALNAVLSSIQDALTAGDRVVITDFGSFAVRDVQAREVRAIRGARQGQIIPVPAHKRVGFTTGKGLIQAVRK